MFACVVSNGVARPFDDTVEKKNGQGGNGPGGNGPNDTRWSRNDRLVLYQTTIVAISVLIVIGGGFYKFGRLEESIDNLKENIGSIEKRGSIRNSQHDFNQ